MNWIECNKIFVPDDSPAGHTAVFFNTYTHVGASPNVWTTVDASTIVPTTAKAIHLTGLIIISHGTTAETADIHLHLRTDQTKEPNYIHQCIETAVGGGQRCTMSCWVALDANHSFQYKYWITNPNGNWPSYSAYAVNLSVDAYAE